MALRVQIVDSLGSLLAPLAELLAISTGMVRHPSICDLIFRAARAHPPGFLEGGMGGAAQCYTAGPLD